MSHFDPRRLEVRQKVIFKRGNWKSSELVVEAEVTHEPTAVGVPIKITKILSKKDLFWWQYQVGRELTASFGELSKHS